MQNNYTFQCPVKGEATTIDYCANVHSNGMQGHPEKTENKICALAHLCWMCPFRNAVSVGAIWSKVENMPKAEKAQEKPAKLPPKLVGFSLAHQIPKASDYRRAGLWGDQVDIHREFFMELQAKGVSQNISMVGSSYPINSDGFLDTSAKKTSAIDAVKNHDTNEMANAVTEAVKEERQRASQKHVPEIKQSVKQKSKERTQRTSNSVSAPSNGKMSLAERAKLMKAKKET